MPIRRFDHSEQRQCGGSDLLGLREVRGGSSPDIGGGVIRDRHHGLGIGGEVGPRIKVCEIVRDPAHLGARIRNRPQLPAVVLVIHDQQECVSFREPERPSHGVGTREQFSGTAVRARDGVKDVGVSAAVET